MGLLLLLGRLLLRSLLLLALSSSTNRTEHPSTSRAHSRPLTGIAGNGAHGCTHGCSASRPS